MACAVMRTFGSPASPWSKCGTPGGSIAKSEESKAGRLKQTKENATTLTTLRLSGHLGMRASATRLTPKLMHMSHRMNFVAVVAGAAASVS